MAVPSISIAVREADVAQVWGIRRDSARCVQRSVGSRNATVQQLAWEMYFLVKRTEMSLSQRKEEPVGTALQNTAIRG